MGRESYFNPGELSKDDDIPESEPIPKEEGESWHDAGETEGPIFTKEELEAVNEGQELPGEEAEEEAA